MVKFLSPVLLIAFVGLTSASYDYGSYGGDSYSYGPTKVDAAVMSNSKVKTVPVMSSKNDGGGNTIVDINGSGGGALVLRFNGGGGNIQSVQKGNAGGGGKVSKQSLVAEPDLLIQNVKKPVIQKVRLQITPIRKVTQEVKPVQEQIETVVAKGMEDNNHPSSKYPPPPLPKYDSY